MRDKTIDCIDVHSGLEDPFLLKKGENSVFLDIVNVCLEVWNETRRQEYKFSCSQFITTSFNLYIYAFTFIFLLVLFSL